VNVEVRTLSDATELARFAQVLQAVWGTSAPIINVELARAVGWSGGYVAGAFTDTAVGDLPAGSMVGASIGLLAVHEGLPALHSHVTGLLPAARAAGVGRAMKLHQRQWSQSRGITAITWTFDPLVRRNAWFNIAVLGADVHSYLPDFYGTMDDAINAGDESDRLYVVWDVTAPMLAQPREALGANGISTIPTPEDVVELRRRDPAAVTQWRTRTRRELVEALDAGRRVVGFTRDGNYVIGVPA